MTTSTERVLQVTLRIGRDRQTQQELNRSLAEMQKHLGQLRAEAVKLKKAIADSQDAGVTRELKKEMAALQSEIADTAQTIHSKFNAALKESQARIEQMRKAADTLENVGQTAASIGAGILGTLALGANQYVQYAGRADEVSRRWLDNQKNLEQSGLRLGRVAAQTILPPLELASQAASDLAAFAERNPWLVKTGAVAGTVLAALGGATSLAGKGIKLAMGLKEMSLFVLQNTAAQKMLTAAGIQAGAANKMSLGGAVGKAAVGVGAVALGGSIGGWLTNEIFGPLIYGAEEWKAYMGEKGPWEKAIESARQLFAVIQYGAANVIANVIGLFNKDWAAKYREVANQVTLAIGGVQQSANALGQSAPLLSQRAVDAYVNYRKAQEKTDADYQKNYTRIVDSYEKQRARAVQDQSKALARAAADFSKTEAGERRTYDKQRAKALVDFHQQDRRAEADYYKQRAQAARSYGREVERAEADHQKSMQRMQQNYNLRQQDAIADRDALAYVQNLRQYETERQQAEQDHIDQVRRSDENYALQLADAEQSFQDQRALRLADFQEQQAEAEAQFAEQQQTRLEQHLEQQEELKAQHAEQLAVLEQQKADELDALEANYREQKAALETGLAEQLAALDQNLLGEQALKNSYYSRMTADLESWLKGNAQIWREGLYAGGSVNVPSGGSTSSDWYGTQPTRRSRYDVIGGRAGGGYVGSGLYQMGEQGREFVLDAPTTRRMERMVGGSLTQQNVVSGGRHDTMTIRVDGGAYNADIVPVIERVVEQFARQVAVQIAAA